MCLQIIGAVVSGVAAFAGMQRDAASARAQGDIHKRQEVLERNKGSYESARLLERGRRLLGRQIAGFSANGIAISGTARNVVESTGTDLAMDVAARRYGASVASENESMLAKVNYQNARSISAAAPLAFLAPVIQGTGTFLKSAYGTA